MKKTISLENSLRFRLVTKANDIGFWPMMSRRDDELLTMTLKCPTLPNVMPITLIGKDESELVEDLKNDLDRYTFDSMYQSKLVELLDAFRQVLDNEPNVFDEALRAAIEKEFPWAERDGGGYTEKLYASYDDEICETDLAKILAAFDPRSEFYNAIDDLYTQTIWEHEDDADQRILAAMTKEGAAYEHGLTESQMDKYSDVIRDYLTFEPDYDHFLKQRANVNIMIDTGDGNYDYCLNAVYPCYAGCQGDTIDNKASIVWLTKQQGYKKSELNAALMNGDIANPKGFLQSLRQELANLPSSMATLTFLVSMTVEDLIAVNAAIKLQDRNGHKYDASVRPNCGQIVLDRAVMCGLYDPWNGGGSVLEIELENDVRLPIRFIRSALPDGCDGYAIAGVYGLGGSAWTDALKEQHYLKGVCA